MKAPIFFAGMAVGVMIGTIATLYEVFSPGDLGAEIDSWLNSAEGRFQTWIAAKERHEHD